MEPSIIVALAAALVVGPVMLVAGVLKARQRAAFEATLKSYTFVPAYLQKPLSFAVPAAEAALGAAVLSFQVPVSAGLGTAALLLVFSAATLKAHGWSGTTDCGCFGANSGSSVKVLLQRNAALVVLATIPVILAFASTDLLTVGMATAGILSLALLARVQAGSTPASVPETEALDPSRRLVLRGGLALGGALVASGVGLLRTSGVVEAACGPCGSCSNQYIFINCTTPCCARYMVRRRQNCNGACYSCSSWWFEDFCGIPGCGC